LILCDPKRAIFTKHHAETSLNTHGEIRVGANLVNLRAEAKREGCYSLGFNQNKRDSLPLMPFRSLATMKNYTGALVASILLSILCATSQSEAKTVAKVNNTEITDDDLAIASEDLAAGLPADADDADKRTYIIDYLIDLKLVALKAEADKLTDTADFKRHMDYYKEKVLMETLFTKIAKDASTDDALHKVYDEAAKTQKPEVEIKARHILVTTKEEAEAAIKRIKAGEDFAKVADEISKDPGSKGGDLGWFTKDKMVPEFANAAFSMKTGEISQPVQSQFGWHVIKVEDQRNKVFPAFDQIKDQISRYVIQKAQADLITKLREGVSIEHLDTAAKPQPAPKQ
jgi:peptidyl-prolyl cis-trans isomerase C